MVTARPSTAGASCRPALDVAAIDQLKGYVDLLNGRAVPIEKAAVAAMELLWCRDKRALEAALEERPGYSSLPQLVKASIDRDAPFRYVLGASEGVRDLGGFLAQGWQALGRRMQLCPPPANMSEHDYFARLKESLFDPSIKELRRGECLLLQPPSAKMILAARDAWNDLVVLTNQSGRSRLQVYAGRDAWDRLKEATAPTEGGIWAMVLLDDAALAASRQGLPA